VSSPSFDSGKTKLKNVMIGASTSSTSDGLYLKCISIPIQPQSKRTSSKYGQPTTKKKGKVRRPRSKADCACIAQITQQAEQGRADEGTEGVARQLGQEQDGVAEVSWRHF
jgi:hypothetical protein